MAIKVNRKRNKKLMVCSYIDRSLLCLEPTLSTSTLNLVLQCRLLRASTRQVSALLPCGHDPLSELPRVLIKANLSGIKHLPDPCSPIDGKPASVHRRASRGPPGELYPAGVRQAAARRSDDGQQRPAHRPRVAG